MRMAAIYARVSSEQQREENTIASQTASLIEFAKNHDLEVPEEWVFEDEGYSGRPFYLVPFGSVMQFGELVLADAFLDSPPLATFCFQTVCALRREPPENQCRLHRAGSHAVRCEAASSSSAIRLGRQRKRSRLHSSPVLMLQPRKRVEQSAQSLGL
jgi:hypothetical protein